MFIKHFYEKCNSKSELKIAILNHIINAVKFRINWITTTKKFRI